MASESDSTEPQSIFDRLIGSRNRDFSLFIPFLLGYSHPGLPRPDPDTHRIILINPVTQTTVALQGAPGLDAPPPASKSAIEAMPRVEIREGEEGACVICLEEWESNGESVKEMPCKHRFHGDCIENWLRLHGSCPVCRFKMPAEEEVAGKKAGDGGELRQEVWVRFAFGSDRTVENDSVVDHSDRMVGNDSVDQSSTVVDSNRTVGRESDC